MNNTQDLIKIALEQDFKKTEEISYIKHTQNITHEIKFYHETVEITGYDTQDYEVKVYFTNIIAVTIIEFRVLLDVLINNNL